MPKKIKTFDLTLLIAPILLVLIGLSVIYSLLVISGNNSVVVRQVVFFLIGSVALVLASFFDYRFFRGTSWIFYIISIILLILVDMFGKVTNGSQNWLDLKVFQLQPSEIAKIFLICALASFFSERIGNIRWRDIFISFLLLIVPLFLIIKEPDFGSALVLCFIYIVMLFVARPSKIQSSIISFGISIFCIVVALSVLNVKPFGNLLHDYQRSRILVFINPDLDPLGRGYNVKQAQITIGSGGILGKGLGKGTQSQLQFLPEANTDFIFAGIAESYGFVGSFVVIALYLLLFSKLIDTANLSRDNFGLLICFGVAAMFFVHVLINIGMNVGLMPVTGIPLPFLSSGGTSLIVSLFSIGLIESIYIRHKKITF
ncbi:MAG: rod shape-determining protein RodA [bacterium]